MLQAAAIKTWLISVLRFMQGGVADLQREEYPNKAPSSPRRFHFKNKT